MSNTPATPYALSIVPTSQRGQVLFVARTPNDGPHTPTCSLQMAEPLARYIIGLQKLEQTVDTMHETITRLMRENEALKRLL